MSKKLKPKPGEKYTDYDGRTLIVNEVKPNDRDGREVVGSLKFRGERKRHKYSTTIEQWRAIWRDKCSPIPIGRMKIG